MQQTYRQKASESEADTYTFNKFLSNSNISIFDNSNPFENLIKTMVFPRNI